MLSDALGTPAGQEVLGPALARMVQGMAGASEGLGEGMTQGFASSIQLATLVSFGMMTDEQLDGLLAQINGE